MILNEAGLNNLSNHEKSLFFCSLYKVAALFPFKPGVL